MFVFLVNFVSLSPSHDNLCLVFFSCSCDKMPLGKQLPGERAHLAHTWVTAHHACQGLDGQEQSAVDKCWCSAAPLLSFSPGPAETHSEVSHLKELSYESPSLTGMPHLDTSSPRCPWRTVVNSNWPTQSYLNQLQYVEYISAGSWSWVALPAIQQCRAFRSVSTHNPKGSGRRRETFHVALGLLECGAVVTTSYWQPALGLGWVARVSWHMPLPHELLCQPGPSVSIL